MYSLIFRSPKWRVPSARPSVTKRKTVRRKIFRRRTHFHRWRKCFTTTLRQCSTSSSVSSPTSLLMAPCSGALFAETNAITSSYQLDFMERLRSHLHSKLAAANVGSFCRLDLFGSARNGFGFCFSDIDLCLRFKEDLLPQVNTPLFVVKLKSALC